MATFKILTLTIGAVALLSIQKSGENLMCSKGRQAPPTERRFIEHATATTPAAKENKIQVALLLDTSNSMDGLIDQAKSRLWNIVNTLTTLKYNGKASRNCIIRIWKRWNQ